MKFSKSEWREWLSCPIAKEFSHQIHIKRQERLVHLASFSEQDTIIKDYFTTKGVCLGLMGTVDLIDELKGGDEDDQEDQEGW